MEDIKRTAAEALEKTDLSRRSFVAATGAAAVAAGLLGVRLTGTAHAQEGEVQVPATPVALGPTVPPELSDFPSDWPVENKNLSMDRNVSDSAINSGNAATLGVAWSFPLDVVSGYGAITSNPLVLGDTIFLQDMVGAVYAIDKASGEQRWKTEYNVTTIGPNGLALGYGVIAGVLGDTAEVFVLNAETGEELWRTDLSSNMGEGVDMAPVIYDNTVYVSTVPGNSGVFYRGGQKGIFYALDITSGHVIWQWDTTTDNLWGNARVNSGGGLWHPPAIDEAGMLYLGVANPGPWPGNSEFPNGTSRPGDNLYTNSLVKIDPSTGSVVWHLQVMPHDLFDLDNQLSPVLATATIDGADRKVVVTSGKHGYVVAADQETGEQLWRTAVGKHMNDDVQEIADGEELEVWPSPLGGVETPFAIANGVVFAPTANIQSFYTATGFVGEKFDLSKAAGELVALDLATGEILWSAEVPTPPYGGATVTGDVVFTGGLDGVVRGYNVADGTLVWSWQATAGLNAPFAAAGDLLLIPAGGPLIASDETSDPAPTPASALYAIKVGAAEASATPSA